MNTELAKPTTQSPNRSALAALATRLQISEKHLNQTLKDTVFHGASDSEFAALVVVANEYKLNPFLKEVHAFKNKKGVVVPVVGIDGWLKLINSNSQFDGMSVDMAFDEHGNPHSATCHIHRKDRNHPITITEYFLECYRKTEPWDTMPRRMLRHKAIKECGRVAFGFSGIYDEDEAQQVSATVATVEHVAQVDPFNDEIPGLDDDGPQPKTSSQPAKSETEELPI